MSHTSGTGAPQGASSSQPQGGYQPTHGQPGSQPAPQQSPYAQQGQPYAPQAQAYAQQGQPYGQPGHQQNPYGQQGPQASYGQQPAPYGYPTAPAPVPAKAKPKTAAKVGKWMFFIGLFLAALSVVAMVIGGMDAGKKAQEGFAAGTTLVDGRGSITMTQNEAAFILEQNGSATSTTTCSVTGPSGPVTMQDMRTSSGQNSDYIHMVGAFTAQAAGQHDISCTGAQGDLSVTSMDMSSMAGGLIGIAGGIVGLLVSGLVGLIGLIMWIFNRR